MTTLLQQRPVLRRAALVAVLCWAALLAGASYAAADQLPSVVHQSLAMARHTLESAGFTVRLEGGDPAPAPELAFAVQSQAPAGGETVSPGALVTLRVYSAGAARVIPDVIGMPAAAARQLLAAQGLAAELEGGDPAPSPELAYRVQSQHPDAATLPAGNAPVRLRIHSDHLPRTVPPSRPAPPSSAPYVFDVLAAGTSDAALRELLGEPTAAFDGRSGTPVKTFEAPRLGIAEATVWYDDVGRARWLRVRLLRSLPPRIAALLFDLTGEPEEIDGNPLNGRPDGVSLRYSDRGLMIFGRNGSTVEIWRIDPTLDWDDVAAELAADSAGGRG